MFSTGDQGFIYRTQPANRVVQNFDNLSMPDWLLLRTFIQTESIFDRLINCSSFRCWTKGPISSWNFRKPVLPMSHVWEVAPYRSWVKSEEFVNPKNNEADGTEYRGSIQLSFYQTIRLMVNSLNSIKQSETDVPTTIPFHKKKSLDRCSQKRKCLASISTLKKLFLCNHSISLLICTTHKALNTPV